MSAAKRYYVYGAIAVLFVAVTAIGLVRGNADVKAAASSSKPVLSVTSTAALELEWPLQVNASGTIVAWQEAIIGAETGGLRITALYVDVGSRVKRGQLLAELSRDAAQADLRRYQASLASAKASLGQARANAERARLVKDSGAISEQQINEYLAGEETAQAAVELAEAQLSVQKVTLEQTRIVAVDDGLITARSALLGQVVSSGSELFRLQRQGRLEWQAEVDAKQLAIVKPGARAELSLPSGKRLAGSVRLVAPTLSTTTGRANVLVSLPDAAAGVSAGMFASGRVEAEGLRVLAVPESAVVLRDGHSYVFEVGSDSKVIRRAVTTGQHRDGLVEVSSGLAAQASLVASGGAFLADGDLVSVGKVGK